MKRTSVFYLGAMAILMGAIACEEAERPSAPPVSTDPPQTTTGGTQSGLTNVAVILVQPDAQPWNDRNGSPIDPVEVANTIMFGDGPSDPSVARLYAEMSFGDVEMEGETFGPYAVTSPQGQACDVLSWKAQALTALEDDADPGDFDRFLFVFPLGSPCTTSNITDTPCQVGGACYLGGCAPNEDVYIFDIMNPSVYAHELGHTFGLEHCSGPRAEGNIAINMDFTSVMSATGVSRIPCGQPHSDDVVFPLHYGNAPQMAARGWIPSANVATIEAAGTYTFDIPAVEVGDIEADPAQDLLVLIDYGSTYATISFRAAVGVFQGNQDLLDLFADPQVLADGHIKDWDGVSWFHSVQVHEGTMSATVLRALLDDGAHDTFASADGRYEVTFLSESDNVAHVEVVVQPEDAISVSPSNVTAIGCLGLDSSHPYTVTIQNNHAFARTYSIAGIIDGATNGLAFSIPTPNPVTVPANSSGQANVVLSLDTIPTGQSTAQFRVRVTQQASPFQQFEAGFLSRTINACTTPPSAPQLSATAPYNWVNLSWTASGGSCCPVMSYEVYRVGAGVIGTTASTSFTDATTAADTQYTYKVRAIVSPINAGPWSNSYKIKTGSIYIEG